MNKVGAELRRIRKLKQLTLEEVASLSGLSRSFVSQVERGVSSPSLVSLEKLCEALEVPISSILGRSDEQSSEIAPDPSPVIRRGEGLKFKIGNYPVQYQHIAGRFRDRQIEALVHEIPPGHRSDLASHDGEEFGYVLEGELILRTMDAEYRLSAGDSYHFVATKPHGYGTPADSAAVVLVVSTQKFVDWYENVLGTGVGMRTTTDPSSDEG